MLRSRRMTRRTATTEKDSRTMYKQQAKMLASQPDSLPAPPAYEER